MEKKNKIKIIIITLAVLLVLSVAALFSTLIYNYLNRNMQTTVSVPDNLITSEEDVRSNSTTDKDSEISGDNKASEKNETKIPILRIRKGQVLMQEWERQTQNKPQL